MGTKDGMGPGLRRGEAGSVAAAVFVFAVTWGWWALALWPASSVPPEWLVRARWVCFEADVGGLPGPSGWLLLIGQPIGMFALLMAVSGRELRSGTRKLLARGWGRGLAGALALSLVLGLGGATSVVRAGLEAPGVDFPDDLLPPDTYPRLDRPAPELALSDQHGDEISLEALRGRPALVTFAFGNCHTFCPTVVRQVLDAQSTVRRRGDPDDASDVPRVVIVSLDPWRDTPSRLAHLADHWALGDGAHLLSGDVARVESVLTAWNVARSRDERTGDIAHPPLVYVVDADGRIRYASTGGREALVALLDRI